MEPAALKALSALVVYGPLGVLAALGFVLYFLQLRRNDKLQAKNDELSEKLFQVSVAAIDADVEHSKAYGPLEKFFDAILQAVVARKS